MKTLNFVEFHLTDVCNLTCTGCSRFSNMGLTGFDDWKKHRAGYENLSKNVNILGEINVLGGEPLMHPMIKEILDDIRSFFPKHQIVLRTNGLLLHKIKDIFKYIDRNKITLDVNMHNQAWRLPIYEKLCELTGEKIKLKWQREHTGWQQAEFYHNDLLHTITLSSHFYQNALGQPGKHTRPYDSDPGKAWKNCESRCPTINNGKLFKCPVSNALPVVIRQKNNIEYTEKQKELIDSFPYILCDEVQNTSDKHFEKLIYDKIDQCSLCPENYVHHKLKEQKISPNYF